MDVLVKRNPTPQNSRFKKKAYLLNWSKITKRVSKLGKQVEIFLRKIDTLLITALLKLSETIV
jgi:hypothetical protein